MNTMKRVLMDIDTNLFRLALLENGEPVEFYVERKQTESLVGNVYAGRVETVVPNLQAAFVDIGTGKNGYLYYGNTRAASGVEKENRPKAGDTLVVQVEKDAVGTKGAVLTRNISFTGKFLALLPNEGGEIGVSRKITNEAERRRMQEIMEELLPSDCGAIVRTNGAGRSKEEFQKELESLLQKWQSVKQAEYRKAPALLWQENIPVLKAARDFYSADLDSVVVNDKETYELLAATGDFSGEGQPKLELYEEKTPLLASFYAESKLEKALSQKVWLKSGGYLVIEETEACVVIDVNSAKAAGRGDLEKMILKTNLEAAEEAAKQMRLRNLSGIIIIDFIDMVQEESRNILTKTLKAAVEKDRVKTVVVGMTELGLMQVTRKKTKPSLLKQTTTNCRSCEGSGRVFSIDWTAAKMRRETKTIFAGTICRKVLVKADARLLQVYLSNGFAEEMARVYGGEVLTESVANAAFGEYEILRMETKHTQNL